jgi:hypothetical protein
MSPTGTAAERLARVESAFVTDGFGVSPVPDPSAGGRVAPCLTKDGWIGVAAAHRTARNTVTGEPKRAFYVEGDAFTMGWLLGAMAEAAVARMATEFVENVAFAFFGSASPTRDREHSRVKDLIVQIIAEASERMLPDIPAELVREIDGLVAGCRAARSGTRVDRSRLMALNLGIDSLLAHVYTGRIFSEKGVHPGLLRTPIGCNAYSLSGDAAGGRHFFGRDFMFPTADVFQDTACLIVYNPDTGAAGAAQRALVSQSAPGIVGTMTGMNASGVAIGVDMLPSVLCSPARPGLNSLLLIRDCMHRCGTADEVVERIADAPRGVSWLYPVADRSGRAFVVEAGRRLEPAEPFPYFECIPRQYRRRLPDRTYIRRSRERYGTPPPRHGLVARAADYRYPEGYVADWNEGLWSAFDRSAFVKLVDVAGDVVGAAGDLLSGRAAGLWGRWKLEIEALVRGAAYSDTCFGERGFINRTWRDRNCPGPFYFAPQRESRPDVLVATNHCISPEMRLTSMSAWIALLAGGNQNDIQWRYDELNRQILDALDAAPGGIDEGTAWQLIDFLNPNGRFPDYYNPGGRDWSGVQVHGSVSLCELTSGTMTSRFGYYGDPPVRITLASYL